MLPVMLDVKDRRIALIAEGAPGKKRLQFLQQSDVEQISLYVGGHDGWACHAEAAVYHRWPIKDDLTGIGIVFIAGLSREQSAKFASMAHAVGALVNVEDIPELCDFHVPATVRRGDLLLTVSTNGKAPGLSSQIRAYLERVFGPEWAQRLNVLADARQGWRAEQRPAAEIAQLTSAFVQREGWLPPERLS